MRSSASMTCICSFRQKSGAHFGGHFSPCSLVVKLLSEVALILRGSMAHRPHKQMCFTAQFLLNFQGLDNFPPAVSDHLWLLSICQQHIVLLTWPLITILFHITEAQVNNHFHPNLNPFMKVQHECLR